MELGLVLGLIGDMVSDEMGMWSNVRRGDYLTRFSPQELCASEVILLISIGMLVCWYVGICMNIYAMYACTLYVRCVCLTFCMFCSAKLVSLTI
jgi:hypothetical protein